MIISVLVIAPFLAYLCRYKDGLIQGVAASLVAVCALLEVIMWGLLL